MQWAFGSAGAGHAFFEAGRLDGRGLVELETYRVQAEKVYLEEQAKEQGPAHRCQEALRLHSWTLGYVLPSWKSGSIPRQAGLEVGFVVRTITDPDDRARP